MPRREIVEVEAPELRVDDRDGHLGAGRRIVGRRELDDGRVEITMQWSSSGRRDIARVDPGRRFKVSRIVAGPGMALRHRARARTTRGLVELWDTEHPEAQVSTATARGHRWALRCEHGTVVGRRTEREARTDAGDPRLWCTDCVERGPRAQLLLPL